MRYEPDELVIRSGLIFRNVRHIPYARVQNLDAVQNVFHRALGVVDVRIETGGGAEPEARLSVLPAADLEEMRARVFAGRARAGGERGAGRRRRRGRSRPAGGGQVRELLHLSLRELLLWFPREQGHGPRRRRVWCALGVGPDELGMERFFVGTVDVRGLAREVGAFLLGRAPLPAGRLVLALGGLAMFLILVRVVSMAWALLRLHDFRLTRIGDDLRVTYGFFTRVAATIPLRRVQTVTIRQGWLHRALAGRPSG